MPTAPWLVVGSVIVALALGYKFTFEHNAAGFCNDFDTMIKVTAYNVRSVVDNVTDHFDGDNNDTYANQSVDK